MREFLSLYIYKFLSPCRQEIVIADYREDSRQVQNGTVVSPSSLRRNVSALVQAPCRRIAGVYVTSIVRPSSLCHCMRCGFHDYDRMSTSSCFLGASYCERGAHSEPQLSLKHLWMCGGIPYSIVLERLELS
jgi:hypothetical protein